jgi:hypothetical protein
VTPNRKTDNKRDISGDEGIKRSEPRVTMNVAEDGTPMKISEAMSQEIESFVIDTTPTSITNNDDELIPEETSVPDDDQTDSHNTEIVSTEKNGEEIDEY